MTIWILAVVILVIVGALGRQIGGIRMGISLIGALVALFVAGPLAPHIRSVLGLVTVKDPVQAWALAAPLAFLGVCLFFNSLAVGTYIKVSGYYKFRAPDDVRMRWERIDAALGLSLGMFAGAVYLIAACAYVFHVGYFTRQVESPTDNAIWLKLVNKMHSDLNASNFDRVAVGVGRASPKFFQSAEALGLVYHNPDLQERALEYPQFLSAAEQPEFQSVFKNDTFKVLLPAKTNATLLLQDPTFRPLLAHPEMQRHVGELDIADFLNFLRTGKSEKYSREKFPLVGRWQLDINATVRQYARANPKATANDQGRLRNLLRAAIPDYALTVTPDEKIFLKGRRDPVAFAGLLMPGYRFPQLDETAGIKTIASGSWKKEGEKHQFTFQFASGERTADANIVEGSKLAAVAGPNTLVFMRAD